MSAASSTRTWTTAAEQWPIADGQQLFAADIDGDGRDEVVVFDPTNVRIGVLAARERADLPDAPTRLTPLAVFDKTLGLPGDEWWYEPPKQQQDYHVMFPRLAGAATMTIFVDYPGADRTALSVLRWRNNIFEIAGFYSHSIPVGDEQWELTGLQVFVADLDGDGDDELILVRPSGELAVFRWNPRDGAHGTFDLQWTAPSLPGWTATTATQYAFARLDPRPGVDLIAYDSGHVSGAAPSFAVFGWRKSAAGDQAFAHRSTIEADELAGWPSVGGRPAPVSLSSVAVGDVDDDGRDELLVTVNTPDRTSALVLRWSGTTLSTALHQVDEIGPVGLNDVTQLRLFPLEAGHGARLIGWRTVGEGNELFVQRWVGSADGAGRWEAEQVYDGHGAGGVPAIDGWNLNRSDEYFIADLLGRGGQLLGYKQTADKYLGLLDWHSDQGFLIVDSVEGQVDGPPAGATAEGCLANGLVWSPQGDRLLGVDPRDGSVRADVASPSGAITATIACGDHVVIGTADGDLAMLAAGAGSFDALGRVESDGEVSWLACDGLTVFAASEAGLARWSPAEGFATVPISPTRSGSPALSLHDVWVPAGDVMWLYDRDTLEGRLLAHGDDTDISAVGPTLAIGSTVVFVSTQRDFLGQDDGGCLRCWRSGTPALGASPGMEPTEIWKTDGSAFGNNITAAAILADGGRCYFVTDDDDRDVRTIRAVDLDSTGTVTPAAVTNFPQALAAPPALEVRRPADGPTTAAVTFMHAPLTSLTAVQEPIYSVTTFDLTEPATVPIVDTCNDVAHVLAVSNGALYYGTEAPGSIECRRPEVALHRIHVESSLIQDFTVDGGAKPRASGKPNLAAEILVEDAAGLPVAGERVTIWSSASTEVEHDGQIHGLDTHVAAVLVTDVAGRIRLTMDAASPTSDGQATAGLSAPSLQLWTEFMPVDERVVFRPDAAIHHALATSLGPAPEPDADGAAAAAREPLLLGLHGYDPDQPWDAGGRKRSTVIKTEYRDKPDVLHAAAGFMRSTLDVVGTSADARRSSPGVTTDYVQPDLSSAVADCSPAGDHVCRAASSIAFAFDLAPADGRPAFSTTSMTDADVATWLHANPTVLHEDFGLGDLWDAIKSGAAAIESGIVHVVDGLEHKIAARLRVIWNGIKHGVDVLVESVEHALTLIHGVFNLIAEDIHKVLEALSTIFSWHKIVAVGKALDSAVRTSLQGMAAPGGALDTLVDKIQDWLPAHSPSPMNATGRKNAPGLTSLQHSFSGTSITAVHRSAGSVTDTKRPPGPRSQGNYLQGKFTGHVLGSTPPAHTAAAAAARPTAPFGLPDPSVPSAAWEAFGTWIDDVGHDLIQLFESIGHTFETGFDVSTPAAFFESLLGVLVRVVEEIADAVLELAADTIVALLRVLQALLAPGSPVWTFLTHTIEIPFLSSLYYAITGEDLTLLSVLTLLVAFPTVVIEGVVDAIADAAADAPEWLTKAAGYAAGVSQAILAVLGGIWAVKGIANLGSVTPFVWTFFYFLVALVLRALLVVPTFLAQGANYWYMLGLWLAPTLVLVVDMVLNAVGRRRSIEGEMPGVAKIPKGVGKLTKVIKTIVLAVVCAALILMLALFPTEFGAHLPTMTIIFFGIIAGALAVQTLIPGLATEQKTAATALAVVSSILIFASAGVRLAIAAGVTWADIDEHL